MLNSVFFKLMCATTIDTSRAMIRGRYSLLQLAHMSKISHWILSMSEQGAGSDLCMSLFIEAGYAMKDAVT